MKEQGIYTEKLPEYPHSLLIAGFDGWGNALDVSKSMVSYLIRKLKAKKFAWINPELFYRYDENRPVVKVAEGRLREISPPGVSFFSARNGPEKEGIVILKGSEPNLRWFQFVDEVLSFCKELKIRKIINVGSMYDDVLHSDRIISGLASDDDLVSHLKQKNILPITYNGPGGIHSTLHAEAQKRDFKCISLWCHCPYYLQGTTHFGLLSLLGSLVSFFGDFELDVSELESSWKEMDRQIKALIDQNPELHAMVSGLRKAKVRGFWTDMEGASKKPGKVIQLRDFLGPR